MGSAGGGVQYPGSSDRLLLDFTIGSTIGMFFRQIDSAIVLSN